MQTITSAEARTMILSGNLPDSPFQVAGELDLSGTKLKALPPQLREVRGLNLENCQELTDLPEGLRVHRLNVNGCVSLQTLPAGLVAHSVQAQRSGLVGLPEGMEVAYKLDLSECVHLRSLPDHLHTGSLIVRGCTLLEALPDDLSLYFLDASNCTRLKGWGATGHVEVGNINLSGCRQLTYLPEWMSEIAHLNIRGCTQLEYLPESMVITEAIELADSGLKRLPPGCTETDIRWRDVLINEQIAFQPETITADQIMKQQNVEVRRVMLERMGYEAFFQQAKAKELHRDVDPGGVRRLLRVEFAQARNQRQVDEPVVCLSVICPSTARHYIIRVPPHMQTCHQAAAWIAGFDDPNLYQPVRET